MKVSIVIPVLNKVNYTKQCLTDIFNSEYDDLEIIVIDNGSNDGTNEFISNISGITLISNKKNLGCAKSWNQGVRCSNGEWIIILNNDVRLPSKWLINLINKAKRESIDILSPGIREGILNYDFESYAENYMDKMEKAFRNWTPNGACFSVSKSVFEKVGFFDENFEIGQYEDADFFRRCKSASLKMGTSGCSFIHHFGSTTQKTLIKNNPTNYALKNQQYHRYKWQIGLIKRNFERYKEKFLMCYWKYKEKYFYGHSLLEN